MDKSRVEPTIFFIEKISFSLKLFSGHFYGQSFIKTVRGPFTICKRIQHCFFGGLNEFKIVVPLFGAAYAAPNKGTTIFYSNFLKLISLVMYSSISEIEL